MEIKLYNTLSRKKEDFTPLKKGVVTMYHCGPTTYDVPHIGNYRTFIMDDLLRRAMEYFGLEVIQAMNITDVDDKTVKRSKDENISLQKLTRRYEDLFLKDLDRLHILRPNHLVRATDNIQEIIELVEVLLSNNVAYKTNDGVYLSIAKVKDYGALAKLNLKSETRERIANDEYDKDNPRDFAVWKFRTDESSDAFWQSPFGEGRPGWHIECSAMSMNILGPTIDIHTGGSDLIFPHHTNEIAQSESATGKTFVKYWVHGGFMTIKDEKMAKSKKNTVKLDDLVSQSISPLSFRYWTMMSHYRSPVDFTFDAVLAAQNALIKLMKIVSDLPEGGVSNEAYSKTFKSFLGDDLDMPKSISLIWKILKDTGIKDADKKATIIDFDKVFGLGLSEIKPIKQQSIPSEIQALIEAREIARSEKDWIKADALRKEIENRGYEVVDSDKGYEVREK